VLEAREQFRQALSPAGLLALPGVVVFLPSHELAPFDQSWHQKLIIEHYYAPLTFQPGMPTTTTTTTTKRI
jgi:hypothetical protein